MSVDVIGIKVMPSAPVTLEMSIIRKIFVIVKYQRNVFLICYEMWFRVKAKNSKKNESKKRFRFGRLRGTCFDYRIYTL